MARNNQRGSRNNNPEGRNQYSNGWMDTARERPMATAAAAAAAVGAGVFLWSRRNQISDQINNLSDQVSGWAESRGGSQGSEMEMAEGGGNFASTSGSSSRSGKGAGRSSMGGSGNASTASSSGGNGINVGGTTPRA